MLVFVFAFLSRLAHPGNLLDSTALILVAAADMTMCCAPFSYSPLYSPFTSSRISPSHIMEDYNHSNSVLKSTNSPFFSDMRKNLGRFLVDKTGLIKNIVGSGWIGDVHLVLRPRQCGKSTMLQMLKSFFSIPQNDDPNPGLLFSDLHIATYEHICTKHMGKYPVIFCDFHHLINASWEGMLSDFKQMAACLYMEWKDSLLPFLEPGLIQTCFESICLKTATEAELSLCLKTLSMLLHKKFGQRVIILIDNYDAPLNYANEHGYFDEAKQFLGDVLSVLLKTNEHLQYAVLAGVLPVPGYFIPNNVEMHGLHTNPSIFAGMLMFTEVEVEGLRIQSNSKLELKDLAAYYGSYIAGAGGSSEIHIRVYNPVSVLSALKGSSITLAGSSPLLNMKFSDISLVDTTEKLLTDRDIDFSLMRALRGVTYTSSMLNGDEALTLLYYAGYLTMTVNHTFKIPNLEVKMHWVRWIVDNIPSRDYILQTCVKGPVSKFETMWPDFMQQQLLDSKSVADDQSDMSCWNKTPEHRVYFLALMLSLQENGWEVTTETQVCDHSDVNVQLVHKQKREAVLIKLKSSKSTDRMISDAIMALEQIADENRRNREGLSNIETLREYGISFHDVDSRVVGQYLVLERQWVEKDDPAMDFL